MSKKKQYRSGAFAAIHETMDALRQIGAIDEKSMRDFDAACLKTVSDIRADTQAPPFIKNL